MNPNLLFTHPITTGGNFPLWMMAGSVQLGKVIAATTPIAGNGMENWWHWFMVQVSGRAVAQGNILRAEIYGKARRGGEGSSTMSRAKQRGSVLPPPPCSVSGCA